MSNQDDNFDLIEEIYLTQEHIKRWLESDVPGCHFFKYEGDLVALKDLCPCYDLPWEPSAQETVDRIIGSSLAKAGYYKDCEIVILEEPHEESGPKRIRKLERRSEAVWTLFRHNDLVIGLHDDGMIVARDIGISSAHEFRVTPQGDFYCHGRVQDEAALGNVVTAAQIVMIRKGLRTWVQRGKGRKTPLGLQRLWRRLKRATEVDLLWTHLN